MGLLLRVLLLLVVVVLCEASGALRGVFLRLKNIIVTFFYQSKKKANIFVIITKRLVVRLPLTHLPPKKKKKRMAWTLLEEEEKKIHYQYRFRNAFCMWWIGMINNLHFTLVVAGAADIAKSYNMSQYVALIMWANVFFGIGANLVNTFVLPLLSYNIRVAITSSLAVFAILLVSFSWDIGGKNNLSAFIVTLIGVVFVGIASNYGGSVFLGYMERLPSWQIGSWSSGTGLSGVVASLMHLGLKTAGLSNSNIFLISIFFIAIYFLLYFFGLKLPFFVLAVPGNSSEAAEDGGDLVNGSEGEYVCKAMVNWNGTPWTNITPARCDKKPAYLREMERVLLERFSIGESVKGQLLEETDDNDVPLGKWATWKRDVWPLVKEMHNCTLWNNVNLALVYVAEYAVQFIVPFSFPCNQVKIGQSFWLKNSFTITQFCYQLGVLVSRSSLICFRTRHVWIMSVVQIFNAIAWFVQAKTKFFSDPNDADHELKFAFVLFAWMIFVGLMGGTSYVNVFYNILEDTLVRQKKEEKDAIDFFALRKKKGGCALGTGNPIAIALNDKTVERDSVEEREAIQYILAVWKEKRDLAMNIGVIYSSIGIAIGSFFDLLYTLVVLRGDECTQS